MEEQLIDLDAFGLLGTRTLTVDGRQIVVEKIHRAGLSCTDVMGADLFYEIPQVKFALIQYKSPNAQGRVSLDEAQVQTLQGACPATCPPSTRFSCGAWYAVRSTTRNAYYPACEARAIFEPYKSRKLDAFINGLPMEGFQQDFARCRIGARTSPVSVDEYRDLSVSQDRVFFHARRMS